MIATATQSSPVVKGINPKKKLKSELNPLTNAIPRAQIQEKSTVTIRTMSDYNQVVYGGDSTEPPNSWQDLFLWFRSYSFYPGDYKLHNPNALTFKEAKKYMKEVKGISSKPFWTRLPNFPSNAYLIPAIVYTPIDGDIAEISQQHRQQLEVSNRQREVTCRKPSKANKNRLRLVKTEPSESISYVPQKPVEGWEDQRPPTLDQLLYKAYSYRQPDKVSERKPTPLDDYFLSTYHYDLLDEWQGIVKGRTNNLKETFRESYIRNKVYSAYIDTPPWCVDDEDNAKYSFINQEYIDSLKEVKAETRKGPKNIWPKASNDDGDITAHELAVEEALTNRAKNDISQTETHYSKLCRVNSGITNSFPPASSDKETDNSVNHVTNPYNRYPSKYINWLERNDCTSGPRSYTNQNPPDIVRVGIHDIRNRIQHFYIDTKPKRKCLNTYEQFCNKQLRDTIFTKPCDRVNKRSYCDEFRYHKWLLEREPHNYTRAKYLRTPYVGPYTKGINIFKCYWNKFHEEFISPYVWSDTSTKEKYEQLFESAIFQVQESLLRSFKEPEKETLKNAPMISSLQIDSENLTTMSLEEYNQLFFEAERRRESFVKRVHRSLRRKAKFRSLSKTGYVSQRISYKPIYIKKQENSEMLKSVPKKEEVLSKNIIPDRVEFPFKDFKKKKSEKEVGNTYRYKTIEQFEKMYDLPSIVPTEKVIIPER